MEVDITAGIHHHTHTHAITHTFHDSSLLLLNNQTDSRLVRWSTSQTCPTSSGDGTATS
jgi:hypothetical protein